MSIVEHNGRRISFVETGSGAAIVFLPPGASPAAAWRPVTDELKFRFKTIAVNPSGYADTESFHAEQPMSLDDEAKATLTVIAGVEQPVHLVGHSYGGAVALRLALMCPARFASLTLIEPAAYPLLEEVGEKALAAEIESVNRCYIERVRVGEPESAFRSYFEYYNGTEGAWSRLPEDTRVRLLSIADTVATALVAVHASPTKPHDCAAISMPTMLVRGSQTDRVHSRVTQLLAEAIPEARLEIVNGAGHMLSLTHPTVVARLMADHIDKS